MGIRARRLAFTTLIFTSIGSMSSSAFADESTTPPAIPSVSSSSQIAGPTTTAPLSAQEVTAISGRPEDPYFEPKGIPLGGPFRLFPNLFTGVDYDDNVFKTLNAPESDFYFIVNPSAVLDYSTDRVRLDLYALGDFDEYVKVGTLDQTNYNFGLTGSYLISGATTATGGVSFARLAEPLSSANVVTGQVSPSQYNDFNTNGQVHFQPNRLGLTIGGSVDQYTYLNTLVGAAHTLFGNHDRDNTLYKGFAQVNYDFSPGYSAFIRGVYNDDHYRPIPDRSGILRSSHGFNIDGGVDLLLGDLIQGEVYAGYVDQNYNTHHTFTIPPDPTIRTLHDISGLDFGANLTWFPTELLTVKLGASRTLQNTTLAGAGAGDDKNVNLTLLYEITRRITANLHASYDDTNYPGTATLIPLQPNRDDHTLIYGVGGKWLISHYVYGSLNYDHWDRSSTIHIAGFHDNTVMVGINLQI